MNINFTTLLLGMLTLSGYLSAQAPLVAAFSAKECVQQVYRQGFDSDEEMEGWQASVTNKEKTWKLGQPSGAPTFTSINPSNKYSLVIAYDDKIRQDEKLTSPEFSIGPNTSCSFYACFDGVFTMYANFTIQIENLSSGDKSLLFDAFTWSQKNGHERPKWLYFSLNLDAYTEQNVRFIFRYEGIGGDHVAVDDFCLLQTSAGEESRAEIMEGESIHFEDLSTGMPSQWEWHFDGGVPAQSNEQHPVVSYNQAGSYDVELTVHNAAGESVSTLRQDFVSVRGIAPVSAIGFPSEGYLSPNIGLFIPRDQEVHFTDASKNSPTSWNWTFQGGTPSTSLLQNPAVSYKANGTYGVSLATQNKQGSDITEFVNYIKVGGTENIWNIEVNEAETLQAIELGWYGYYAGSNTLGMKAFAEYFKKPLTKGSISEVAIYFAEVTTITPDTLITVSIALPKDGLPGEVLARAQVKASQLIYEASTWLPTIFSFSTPVSIDSDFFVTVEGIPSHFDEETYASDAIAIGSIAPRKAGGACTVYHYLEEWDENDQPTGNSYWLKNTDELISLAIAPLFTYTDKGSSIETEKSVPAHAICNSLFTDRLSLFGEECFDAVTVYTLTGITVYHSSTPDSFIDSSSWSEGFYVIKAVKNGKVYSQKIRCEK